MGEEEKPHTLYFREGTRREGSDLDVGVFSVIDDGYGRRKVKRSEHGASSEVAL